MMCSSLILNAILQDSRYLGKGSSDGFFGGYRYFECQDDCGLFVSLDKLAAKPPHQVSSTPVKFKIDDHMVVYNKDNVSDSTQAGHAASSVGNRECAYISMCTMVSLTYFQVSFVFYYSYKSPNGGANRPVYT